jgi:hypothetical protein
LSIAYPEIKSQAIVYAGYFSCNKLDLYFWYSLLIGCARVRADLENQRMLYVEKLVTGQWNDRRLRDRFEAFGVVGSGRVPLAPP